MRFADEVSTRTQGNKTFRRREDVMIKAHEILYPPTQANKGWYGPFTIFRIRKNDRVEVWDHTRWYAKVSTMEIIHLRDYIEGLSTRYEEPDPNGFKCI